MKNPTFYIASKTIHAPRWRELRGKGYDIISTWIDEAGPGESPDLVSLAVRCITEPTQADYTILYCEPGEHLKFALVEVGAALAAGKEVYLVGSCESISPTMMKHPLCKDAVLMGITVLLSALTFNHSYQSEDDIFDSVRDFRRGRTNNNLTSQ